MHDVIGHGGVLCSGESGRHIAAAHATVETLLTHDNPNINHYLGELHGTPFCTIMVYIFDLFCTTVESRLLPKGSFLQYTDTLAVRLVNRLRADMDMVGISNGKRMLMLSA
jgi:hypothetical protein